ncbi:sulfurtransferase complex subunit TusB [Marinobacter lipolyticus]|nr:sulfurtransferase complex subunit TusB [Marinobacter lipolyticus]
MHTLHIISKSPGHTRFRECLGMMGEQDAILLTGNAVTALADSTITLPETVYALQEDLRARAIDPEQDISGQVTFDDMVSLTIQAQRVISW